jgi:hypothetical protein
MEYGIIDGERNIPMDTEALKQMLSQRPMEAESELEDRRTLPPDPTRLEAQEVPPEKKGVVEPTSEPETMRDAMLLPPQVTIDKLKAQYGELRACPMLAIDKEKKAKTYILKILNRAEWRAAQELANKISESKPDRTFGDILEEKIVYRALVWPRVPEAEFALLPAGLITTLFGVAQQMACFYSPEAVMQFSVVL